MSSRPVFGAEAYGEGNPSAATYGGSLRQWFTVVARLAPGPTPEAARERNPPQYEPEQYGLIALAPGTP